MCVSHTTTSDLFSFRRVCWRSSGSVRVSSAGSVRVKGRVFFWMSLTYAVKNTCSSSFNATKIQAKKRKLSKAAQLNVSNVVRLVAVEPPQVQVDSNAKSLPEDPDVTNIDGEIEDPPFFSLYAVDIYDNLRVAELSRRPYPHFMETLQRDINQNMRGLLIDWLVAVYVCG
ncbi:hypothetical protein RIF29_29381 [Crotalaria pallida]|uniref:B-like cyclin n=1 Tax=Crotalaria pallida TaxID=3830 RepID=A0AAN9HVW0_CROPI